MALAFPMRVALFIKLNLYSWLLLAGAAALVTIVLLLTGQVVWWGVLLFMMAIAMLFWAVSIAWQFPRKLAILRKHLWLHSQGRFTPERVAGLCTDPCYRLLALHILLRTGYRRERWALVRQMKEDQLSFRVGTLIVDDKNGVSVTLND